jgi:uncharacterized protein DUF4402
MSVAIRRIWLAAQFTIVAAIAAPAHAQSSVAGSIGITAQVVTPLALIVSHSLDFGRLLTSTTRTIAPGAATSGHFELVGQGGSAVTVTLSMPSQLTPTTGTNMPITGWTYVVSDSPSLGGTPVSFTSGTSAPIAVTFETFAGSTKLYFGIGATVSASATQPTTPYTGTGQITAAYTDL